MFEVLSQFLLDLRFDCVVRPFVNVTCCVLQCLDCLLGSVRSQILAMTLLIPSCGPLGPWFAMLRS